MAVQKCRNTRSRRGMCWAHLSLINSSMSTDDVTGERHLRHHVTADGFYRGKKVIDTGEE